MPGAIVATAQVTRNVVDGNEAQSDNLIFKEGEEIIRRKVQTRKHRGYKQSGQESNEKSQRNGATNHIDLCHEQRRQFFAEHSCHGG
jgi:hypothetical protein